MLSALNRWAHRSLGAGPGPSELSPIATEHRHPLREARRVFLVNNKRTLLSSAASHSAEPTPGDAGISNNLELEGTKPSIALRPVLLEVCASTNGGELVRNTK